MKKLIIAIAAVLTVLASCRKIGQEEVEIQIPVTFTNTAGDWVLSKWKGTDMDASSVYIRLNNKEFILWQDVASMFPVKYTGEYNIYEIEGVGNVIRGMYDYTYEYWDHQYVITSLTTTKMEWTSLDDPTDISVYKRTDSFPID